MIWTLALMEWRRLMRSPLAWLLMAFGLLLMSWQFLEALETYSGLQTGRKSLGLTAHLSLQLNGFAAVLILFVTPILTMRLFSEAFRNGSYSLMSSAPLSLITILTGKYLGILLFQLFFVLSPLLLSLTLITGTHLDFGLLAASTLGLFLISACFTAIGVYLSTISATPGIAAAASYGVLLLISILGPETLSSASGLLHWFAWPNHYLSLQLGLVRSADLSYFLLLSLLFLALAWHQLDKRRRG